MEKLILPKKVENLRRITWYMLLVFSISQALGLWLIYSDVNYAISNIDPETMEIPKAVHNTFQRFIYGSSVSLASGFGALVLACAWKLRRPYKNKAIFFLYLGFILQILFVVLGFVSSYINKNPYFSIENLGLLSTLLWSSPVVLAASNKVVRAWSVELVQKAPSLPLGAYEVDEEKEKNSFGKIQKNKIEGKPKNEDYNI
jgi:hypothetical protein